MKRETATARQALLSPADSGGEAAGDNKAFFVTGGTVPPDAPSYVERQADKGLLSGLLEGEYCFVLNSRQMGKSSLSVRTIARLREQGVQTAFVDLTKIGAQNVTPEQWYAGLLAETGRTLNLRREFLLHWKGQADLPPVQRYFSALREVALETIDAPLVVFVDEIDAVRSLSFPADEFFGAVRACFNARTEDAAYRRLTFCLVGSATPADLIIDTRISPFNVGRRIDLRDFTPDEAAPLAQGLGPDGTNLLARVLYWTGGHPYLTQRLCRTITESEQVQTVADVDRLCDALLLSKTAQESDDNLSFVRSRLLRSEVDLASLLDLYRQVRQGKKVRDDETNSLIPVLRLSGVVKVERGLLKVRNRIYDRVFDKEWVTTHMPDAELRRQRAAYRRGLLRAATVAAFIVLTIASLAGTAFRQSRLARAAQERERETRIQTQRLLYVSDMNVAQQALESGNLAQAQELLERHRPRGGDDDLRGFEWRYLWAMSRDLSKVTLRRHKYPVKSVAFSPDGHWFASADDTSHVKLWDAASQREVAIFEGKDPISLTFSPDGKILALACVDHTVRLLSIPDFKQVLILKHPGIVWDVAFMPSGKQIAASCGDVMLWDLNTRKQTGTLHIPGKLSGVIALSKDGRVLATTDPDGSIRLWHMPSKRQIAFLSGHTGIVSDMAFSPDGKMLASAGFDKTVRVWDVAAQGARAILRGHARAVPTVAFSQDGELLAAGSEDGTVKIWDAVTLQERITLRGHTGMVNTLAFSPDGHVLATGSDDTTIKLWDPAARPSQSVVLRHPAVVLSVALSPDQRLLASGGIDKVVRLWSVATRQVVAKLQGHRSYVQDVTFSPDGSLLASAGADGTIRLWEPTARRCIATLRATETPGVRVLRAVFSPDGRVLVSIGDEKCIRFWDVAARRQTDILSDTAPVSALAFSPEGKTLAVGNYDGTITLWEAATAPRRKKLTLSGHRSGVIAMTFSGNGRHLASASADGTVKVWDIGQQEATATFRAQVYSGNNLVFSPDGRTLAAGGMDGAVQLWNVATGQMGASLRGHELKVRELAFSRDWSILASGSEDTTVRVWRAPSFTETDRKGPTRP